MKLIASLTLVLAAYLPVDTAFAQQAAAANSTPSTIPSSTNEVAKTVVIESTITGNQEQPKTIYVLPWQDSVARIKMPAAGKPKSSDVAKPLDREQFLRFIQAQPKLTPSHNSRQDSGQTAPASKVSIESLNLQQSHN